MDGIKKVATRALTRMTTNKKPSCHQTAHVSVKPIAAVSATTREKLGQPAIDLVTGGGCYGLS